MKRIAIWAVIVGGIGDILLTNVFNLPIALDVYLNAGLGRLPQAQVGAAYLAALHADPPLYLAALGAGVVASFLGGIIAALMARHDRILNGALSAWACLAIDAYTFVTHTSTDGLLLQIALVPVAPIAAALGGIVVARMSRRPSKAALPAAE